jgi:CheY-like chemotaxis protein
VVTDVIMPRMNGWSLVRRLRSTHETSFIPVIFMTSMAAPRDRIRGFRIGADDYVTKPVDLDELELRVENVLHHTRESRHMPHVMELTGDLASFGLSTPLTMLELHKKTGVLTVERGAERAEVTIKDGNVANAELIDLPALPPIDCLCELLSWTTGRFAFEERDVSAPECPLTTTALLLEAAQRLDEDGLTPGFPQRGSARPYERSARRC